MYPRRHSALFQRLGTFERLHKWEVCSKPTSNKNSWLPVFPASLLVCYRFVPALAQSSQGKRKDRDLLQERPENLW